MSPRRNEVTSRTVPTDRLHLHVREAGAPGGFPVLFIHGNCSNGAFFTRLMERLPEGLRAIAPDLRGFGATEPAAIDATRGMRDFSDDVASLMDALGIERAAFVAHSAGAGTVMQLAIDHPGRVTGMVLEAPMSPYGFGGTRDVEGRPCWPDFSGSGGGTANAEFAQRIAAGDRTRESPVSPHNVMATYYVRPPFTSEDDDMLLEAVLSTRVSDQHYPGTIVPSENWPGVAPGTTGMNNAISPRYFDVSAFADVAQRPDVLWIRGDVDQIVSDTSLFDLGYLGQLGAVPGWPGAEVYPPQPMLAQTRAVLDRYAKNGGLYREEVLPETGHSPHLERPAEFDRLALPFLLEHVR